ncbi:MAG TPA: glycosyltransferase [Chloroflexi bacterium]|nr:glycosyltransferase [Chloroflexota bacterium]
MKPRVALLIPSLRGGGVFRVMTNLALGLQEHGCRVSLIVGTVEGCVDDSLLARLTIVDLGVEKMAAGMPKLTRWLHANQPDFLISAQMHVNLTAIAACALAGTATRLIVTEHNDVDSVYRHAPTLKQRVVPWLAKVLYPRADRIIAVSQGVADSLAAWLKRPVESIAVIYNPLVDTALLDHAQELPNHVWFQDGGLPVILGVGRLEEQKDFATLLRAFALLIEQVPARLMILGEGSQRKMLETLAQDLGVSERVAMPGYVSNPYACMQRAALFVLSSAWEGFPSVLVEAMACGCRMVSTDCPSGPREILENGRWGALTPVGDAGAMASAMLAALQTPPPDAVVQAAQRFSVDAAVAQYLQVMEAMQNT